MLRKSMDPDGTYNSPLAQGRTDKGYENIFVKVLHWPEEDRFKQLVYKATMATRGLDVGNDEYDEVVVEDAFAGGLNQCLEWVTVVFEISGVTRGFTHQLVRTRKGSFAQQSFRATYMGAAPNMRMPLAIQDSGHVAQMRWSRAVGITQAMYDELTRLDIPYQDARTVLPIATETYIIAAYPLGVFLQTYAYRACSMMYPETVYTFRLMGEKLKEQCPWLEPYIKIICEKTDPREGHAHQCTFQGWEQVEGECPLPWATEDNRVWKSRRFQT